VPKKVENYQKCEVGGGAEIAIFADEI